jgi:hypothetical protein
MYDFEISLPNGYSIVRFNKNELALFGPEGSPQETRIDPTIDGYAIAGPIVFGHAEPPRKLPGSEAPMRTVPEFFVVDTRDGHIWRGTDKDKWITELERLGVSDPPELRVPSLWDSLPF